MIELAPPSRDSNPFATCWTRPGALPFLRSQGVDHDRVAERLRLVGYQGQLVGPHGSGKSTLLRSLAQSLGRYGVRVRTIDARQRRNEAVGSDHLLLLEGLELLSRRKRAVWLGWLRAKRKRYVLATHTPIRGFLAPAVLAELRPDTELLKRLFDMLVANRETPVTLEDALCSHRLRGGNLREVWFDLYDLHERRNRPKRTASVHASYYV